MAYNALLPGSFMTRRDQLTEYPSAGAINQTSCYNYLEKVAPGVCPTSLQADLIYPNALNEICNSNPDISDDGDTPVAATGCKGHMVDVEFPLESRTPFAVPLVMYPTRTDGREHHEIDLCAVPVLNWEGYIQDVRMTPWKGTAVKSELIPGKKAGHKERGSPVLSPQGPDPDDPSSQSLEDHSVHIPPSLDSEEGACGASPSSELIQGRDEVPSPENCETEKMKKVPNSYSIIKKLIDTEKTYDVENTPAEHEKRRKKELAANRARIAAGVEREKVEMDLTKLSNIEYRSNKKKLPPSCIHKIKCFPKFCVQGTWNNLFGGYNGACCFMKTGSLNKSSKSLQLFTGKGSLLRSIKLEKSSPSSMLSHIVQSVWDEDKSSISDYYSYRESEPWNAQIFQIVPNETSNLLAVRRGRSVQIYSTEEETPYVLESVPNIHYGTDEYLRLTRSEVKLFSNDPLLTGVDFNPIFCTEIVTVDENHVVRFCDIGEQSTKDSFSLPKNFTRVVGRPEGYPPFVVNEASGVTYTNSNDLFYGWANSTVYLGDRRDPAVSRSHIMQLLNVRSDACMKSITVQNFFHANEPELNEYISCVRRSREDPYYYVGTSSSIYLMDLRVPSLPVMKVNHGLQTPLTYMDTYSDENYETLIGGSQRMPETMCLITNKAHTLCVERSGCQARNPILHGYPRHLSNSRFYFDFAIKQGWDFPLPCDYDQIKSHHYAWTTGLSVYPVAASNDAKIPRGVLIATSNNFGDIFWQEWNQKPITRHLKTRSDDYKFQKFVSEWRNAVTPKVPVFDKDSSKQSQNPKNPVDCSILVEPLAKEITKLPRIRDYKFNCFKPHADQYRINLEKVTPVPKLLSKLKAYKNEKVKGMLEVWKCDDIMKKTSSANNNMDQPESVEEIVIKSEVVEDDGDISFTSLNTIDIDASDQEDEANSRTHLQELVHIQQDIHRSINTNDYADEPCLEDMDNNEPESENEEDVPEEECDWLLDPSVDPLSVKSEEADQNDWFPPSMQRMNDDNIDNYNDPRIHSGDPLQPTCDDETFQFLSQPLFASQEDCDSYTQFRTSSSQEQQSSSMSQNRSRLAASKRKKSGFL